MPEIPSTFPAVPADWPLLRERYVRSHLPGPAFAAAEGVDYGRLRWHVAHGHWRADRKAFRERAFAQFIEAALRDRSSAARPGDGGRGGGAHV